MIFVASSSVSRWLNHDASGANLVAVAASLFTASIRFDVDGRDDFELQPKRAGCFAPRRKALTSRPRARVLRPPRAVITRMPGKRVATLRLLDLAGMVFTLVVVAVPHVASAATQIVVGDGTSESCTQLALQDALIVAGNGGGTVRFRCFTDNSPNDVVIGP
jgi:hypothetical protein